jgi:hypothetical protein
MKTTVKNKKKIIALAGLYEEIALLLRTEIPHPNANFFRYIKLVAGIAWDNTRNLDAPVKKGAKNHGVRVRRGR